MVTPRPRYSSRAPDPQRGGEDRGPRRLARLPVRPEVPQGGAEPGGAVAAQAPGRPASPGCWPSRGGRGRARGSRTRPARTRSRSGGTAGIRTSSCRHRPPRSAPDANRWSWGRGQYNRAATGGRTHVQVRQPGAEGNDVPGAAPRDPRRGDDPAGHRPQDRGFPAHPPRHRRLRLERRSVPALHPDRPRRRARHRAHHHLQENRGAPSPHRCTRPSKGSSSAASPRCSRCSTPGS